MFKSERQKKNSEISPEKFGGNKKVLTFAPAFRNTAQQKPTICNVKAEAEVLKNFEKKDAKIFGRE